MAAKKVIRLWRRGHKHYAFYQIVVIISSKRARGPFFESLGFFNPHTSERQLRVKGNRLAYWMNRGAQVHPSVIRVLSHYVVGKKK